MKRLRLKSVTIFMLIIFLLDLVIPVAIASDEKKLEGEETKTSESIEPTEQPEEKEEEPTEEIENNESKFNTEQEENEIDENKVEEQENKQNSDQKENDTNEENGIMSVRNSDTQVVLNGTYKIKANVGSNMYLDIERGPKNSGANLQIWARDNVKQQQFQITYLKNGYHSIKAEHSGKFIDVYNANKSSGTNVWQCTGNSTDAQQWKIIKNTNGTYTFISKCNNLALDVYNANPWNGTNIQVATQNKTKAQQFSLEEVKHVVPEHTLDNGIYKIKANVGTSKYLDIDKGSKADGANLQIWTTENVDQQRFEIKDVGGGYYTIMSIHSKKVLDVYDAGTANGTNVWQYKNNGTDAQKWILKKVKDNKYNIISKCSDSCLDVYNANTSNGTNVQICESNGTNAQIFTFEKVVEPKEGKTIDDGVYKIKANIGTNMYLDIDGGKTIDNANLQIWQKSNVKQQLFQITYLNNGYYKIISVRSGKSLDVDCSGKINETNVKQYTYSGVDAQQWIIQDAGNDCYNIISKCSKTCLDIAGRSTKNGTNVQIYENLGVDSQKFKFEKADIEREIYDGTYRISSAICYEDARFNAKNYAIDIDAGSKKANANLQIWSSTNVLQQKFIITRVKDGYYTIEPSHASGMVLQVSGTNVVQSNKNINLDSQLWMIEKSGNQYWTIKSKLNGKYLDVYDGKLKDGQNVQVWESNGTNAQKWKIEEVYFGIDLSEHQGQIDYNALINSRRAEYAIIRLGPTRDGGTRGREIREDYTFAENYNNLHGRIPLGAYVYTYADTLEEVKKEAWAVIDFIESRKLSFELPIFFDFEDVKQANLSTAYRTSMCKAFCDILRQKGYKAGIYSDINKLNTWIYVDQMPSDVSIWVAGWGYNDGYVPGNKYMYTKKYNIWQYSSQASIDGISKLVDVNITFKKTW